MRPYSGESVSKLLKTSAPAVDAEGILRKEAGG